MDSNLVTNYAHQAIENNDSTSKFSVSKKFFHIKTKRTEQNPEITDSKISGKPLHLRLSRKVEGTNIDGARKKRRKLKKIMSPRQREQAKILAPIRDNYIRTCVSTAGLTSDIMKNLIKPYEAPGIKTFNPENFDPKNCSGLNIGQDGLYLDPEARKFTFDQKEYTAYFYKSKIDPKTNKPLDIDRLLLPEPPAQSFDYAMGKIIKNQETNNFQKIQQIAELSKQLNTSAAKQFSEEINNESVNKIEDIRDKISSTASVSITQMAMRVATLYRKEMQDRIRKYVGLSSPQNQNRIFTKKELRQYEDLKKSFTNAGGNPEDFPEFETEKKYKPYLLQYHMQPATMTQSMKQAVIPAYILDAYDDHIETYADIQQTYEKIDNFITTLGNGDFSAGFNKLPTDIQNKVITIHSEKLILDAYDDYIETYADVQQTYEKIDNFITTLGNGDFSAGFNKLPTDIQNKVITIHSEKLILEYSQAKNDATKSKIQQEIEELIRQAGNGDFSAGFNKLPTDIQNKVITIHSEKLILDACDDYIETYEKIDNFITTLGNGDFSAGFNKLPTDIQNKVITIHSEKLILEYSQAKNDATKSKIQQEIEELIRQAGNGDFSAGFANITDDTLNKINEIFFPS